jgi:biopolymer transport protein ExbB
MAEWMSKLALFDYFDRGGPWMWALLACSIVALAIILFKILNLWYAGRGASALTAEVSRLVQGGNSAAAAQRCTGSSAAVGSVLRAVLAAAGSARQAVQEAAQSAGARQLAALESGLPVLSIIANVAPLIGFLGTVSGMIRAFTAIAERGLGEPGIVAGGIGEALITTASGLIVAIPCFIAYGIFVARVNGLALDMELAGSQLVNLVSGDGDNEA